MKKIFNTFITNTILAAAAALGLIYQEISLTGDDGMLGTLGIGAMGALGGSVAGEVINMLAGQKTFNYINAAIGAVAGFAIGSAAALAI